MATLPLSSGDRSLGQLAAYAWRVALELVYETHAITTDNEAGVATGWLPGELSERGRATAADLGARRRGDGMAAVYASDLRRAVQTVEIAFASSSVPILFDARLRECDYGMLNGMPSERLERERVRHVDEPWPQGESYLQVVERTRSFLVDLLARWNGFRVLLVSHSANKWALDYLLLGEDLYESVAAGMTWQKGWEYVVRSDWDSH